MVVSYSTILDTPKGTNLLIPTCSNMVQTTFLAIFNGSEGIVACIFLSTQGIS